jgi:hypothetical protein
VLAPTIGVTAPELKAERYGEGRKDFHLDELTCSFSASNSVADSKRGQFTEREASDEKRKTEGFNVTPLNQAKFEYYVSLQPSLARTGYRRSLDYVSFWPNISYGVSWRASSRGQSRAPSIKRRLNKPALRVSPMPKQL